MPLKIVRNDITKMKCDAIVNTANEAVAVGSGCDAAVYEAAGREKLLAFREKHIGPVPEGEAFVTPGFELPAKYIIHAVSPRFIDGEQGEEERLRRCYRNSLALAEEYGLGSLAIPLIATGSYGYPKEEGMRIAVDEIRMFLEKTEMLIYLVVFDESAVSIGKRVDPGLESYIDAKYVRSQLEKQQIPGDVDECLDAEEISEEMSSPSPRNSVFSKVYGGRAERKPRFGRRASGGKSKEPDHSYDFEKTFASSARNCIRESMEYGGSPYDKEGCFRGEALEERIAHLSDTFSEYLLYLIKSKGMTNSEVYKRAIVDKKVFSKIKNNPSYHPQKITAMCLCIGARLNLDEARDLLARAGYALSPCDITDVIFSYFIEEGIYDMIELDIQLEEHGAEALIS